MLPGTASSACSNAGMCTTSRITCRRQCLSGHGNHADVLVGPVGELTIRLCGTAGRTSFLLRSHSVQLALCIEPSCQLVTLCLACSPPGRFGSAARS